MIVNSIGLFTPCFSILEVKGVPLNLLDFET